MRSISQDGEETNQYVTCMILAKWLKLRKMSWVISDCELPIKFKGKFYHTPVWLCIRSSWILGFKGTREQAGSCKTEFVEMNVWLHKK